MGSSSSALIAFGLGALAIAAAMFTGAWTGERFADPIPTVTQTVEPPAVVVTEHRLTDVDAASAPTVTLTVTEDVVEGYNLRIDTTNFTWTPENVNTSLAAGTGHANVYVDNVFITRAYGPDVWIDAGGPGSTVEVYLAANDLSEYSVGGVAITGSAVISAPAAPTATPSP